MHVYRNSNLSGRYLKPLLKENRNNLTNDNFSSDKQREKDLHRPALGCLHSKEGDHGVQNVVVVKLHPSSINQSII